MSHDFWFWLMIAVVGFVYFRYGMPAFRKMGVSIDAQASPPRQAGQHGDKDGK